jgi:hypothetical protein
VSDLYLKLYDLNLINFNEMFSKEIQFDIINDLHKFELLDKSINNKDTNKIFLHYIIYHICNKILKMNSKSVIFFNYNQLDECELMKYYSEKDILTVMLKIINKLNNLLPIILHISKLSIDYLKHLIEIGDGKSFLTINSIRLKCDKLDTAKYTFSGVKKMTKKYDLTFLNNDYFNRLSTKLLLIK